MNEFTIDQDGFLVESEVRQLALRVQGDFPWADPLAFEAMLMLARAYQAHTKAVRPTEAEFGLSGARYSVLRCLYLSDDGRLSMKELAKRLLVTAPNVTRLVEGLVKDGLVTRAPDQDDRRMAWIELTDEGRSLFETLRPRRIKQAERHFGKLDDQEKRLLIHLLSKLRMSILMRPGLPESLPAGAEPAGEAMRR